MVEVHLATALGQGGISVVILAGKESDLQLLDAFVHKDGMPIQPIVNKGDIRYGVLVCDGDIVDEVLLSCPETGKRIVTGHGGSVCAQAILQAYIDSGAIENGSLMISGLWSADSVASAWDKILPLCITEEQAALVLMSRQILDSAGSYCTKEFVRNFLTKKKVCLAGAPNVGKSSLLNRLTGMQRVLVSDVAGTTRDAVTQLVNLGGYAVELVDTAGFRKDAGELEQEAQRRGTRHLSSADVIIWVIDGSKGLGAEDIHSLESITAARARTHQDGIPVICVINKADLPQAIDLYTLPEESGEWPVLTVSCQDEKFDDSLLTHEIVHALGGTWNGCPCLELLEL